MNSQDWSLYGENQKMWTIQRKETSFELQKNGTTFGCIIDIERANNEQCVKIKTRYSGQLVLSLGKFDWRANEVSKNFKDSLHSRSSFVLKWKQLTNALKPSVEKARLEDSSKKHVTQHLPEHFDKSTKIKTYQKDKPSERKSNLTTQIESSIEDDSETSTISNGTADKEMAEVSSSFERNENNRDITFTGDNESTGSFEDKLKEKFQGYFTLKVEQLQEPASVRLVRPAERKHVEELKKEFLEKPNCYFTMMAVNLTNFAKMPINYNDCSFETIGGNHTRLALQEILKDDSIPNQKDYESRMCAVYCQLSAGEATRIGMDHNNIHKFGKELNFFKRIECFRCTLFQLGGLNDRDAIDKDRTPTGKSTVVKWKKELENITGVKSRKQLNNNFRFDISLAQLPTSIWKELKMFVYNIEEKQRKPVSGRQMKCLDGLAEDSFHFLLRRANREELCLAKLNRICKEAKEVKKGIDEEPKEEVHNKEAEFHNEDVTEDQQRITEDLQEEKSDDGKNWEEEAKHYREEYDRVCNENRLLKIRTNELEVVVKKKEELLGNAKEEKEENKRKMAKMYSELIKLREENRKRKNEPITKIAECVIGVDLDLNPSPNKMLRKEENKTIEASKKVNCQQPMSQEKDQAQGFYVNQIVNALWKEDNTWYEAIVLEEKKTGFLVEFTMDKIRRVLKRDMLKNKHQEK